MNGVMKSPVVLTEERNISFIKLLCLVGDSAITVSMGSLHLLEFMSRQLLRKAELAISLCEHHFPSSTGHQVEQHRPHQVLEWSSLARMSSWKS